jgi:hypothetical protein
MRFLTIALSFISFSVLACPQLSGSYPYCRSMTGNVEVDRDVVVSQAVVNGATEFTVSLTDSETNERSTDTVRADGINRTVSEQIPELGITVEYTSNASCAGNILLVNASTKFDGAPVGSVTSRVWKVGSELHQETKGEMFGEEVNESVVCQ